MGDSGRMVSVFARVRPPLPREIVNDVFTRCLGVPQGNPSSTVVVTKTDAPVLLNIGEVAAKNSGLKTFSLDEVLEETASNADVYKSTLQSLVSGVTRDGVNGCLFCYGQSGSGKTHTVQGDGADPGLLLRAAKDILAVEGNSNLSMSYLQIYGRDLSDLLLPSNTTTSTSFSHLRVRESPDGEVFVEGLSRCACCSLSLVQSLLTAGHERRAVTCTNLNATSSRSHAIVTFFFEKKHNSSGNDEDERGEGSVAAKLNLVDLAGSERVKDSGVEGQSLKEACQINLSLFNLARVVKALSAKGNDKGGSSLGGGGGGGGQLSVVVPFKDDVLTFFLKDSLTGCRGCRTAIVATVSPSQLHAAETSNTLAFAVGCTRLPPPPPRSSGSTGIRPWQEQQQQSVATLRKAQAKEAARHALALPWAGVALGDPARCPGKRCTLHLNSPPLLQNRSVSALVYGPPFSSTSSPSTHGAPQQRKRLAVLLHGYPSDSESSWGHSQLVPALTHAGFTAMCLDMPGCGRSPGPSFPSTRSEHALDPGGPADVVAAAIDALVATPGGGGGVVEWEPTAVLVGCDWGGGVAFAMAASRRHKHRVKEVVALLPSFQATTAKQSSPLRAVRARTLVCWSKDDQFHSWSAFQAHAKALKGALTSNLPPLASSSSSSSSSAITSSKHASSKSSSPLPSTTISLHALGSMPYAELVVPRSSDPLWGDGAKARRIVAFLTGVDFLPAAQVVKTRPKAAATATDGKEVTASHNVVFRLPPQPPPPPAAASGGAGATAGKSAADLQGSNNAAATTAAASLYAQSQQPSTTADESDAELAMEALKQLHQKGELGQLLRSAVIGGGAVGKITLQTGGGGEDSSSGASGAGRQVEWKRTFARLPVVRPGAGTTPSSLAAQNLWTLKARDGALALSALAATAPRYGPGRLVVSPDGLVAKLVRVETESSGVSGGGGNWVSESGNCGQRSEKAWAVLEALPTPEDASSSSSLANAAEIPRQKRVPLSALLLMNQRHEFPTMDTPAVSSSKRVPQQQQYDPATSNAKLVLEDGITCKYDSPLTKAKMAHIALALSPLLEAIGEELASSNAATATSATTGGRREGGEGEAVTFAKHGVSGTQGTPKLRALRLRCIVAIRACLDLDTFQRRKGSSSSKSGAAAADNEPGAVRGRDRRRYCKDDAGQFMCFGEGHCHTVSSVMAAALLPFTEVLSVDLRYREDQGGHHQWLEFTLLGPANPETFVCDLYREHTARLMRGAGEGRGIKRSIGKGRREERKEGEIDRSNGFVDEVLVQPIATAYDSWMGANCHGLVPAPFLKVLTGRPIRAAALEDGDVLFVTPPLCSST